MFVKLTFFFVFFFLFWKDWKAHDRRIYAMFAVDAYVLTASEDQSLHVWNAKV